eukprot:CAMPEP_0205819164 /NCGR_PEP_ID=MMETSP0206-20130828/1421_1 /ASSEMBLY_ACC=CAM_ASM_000279 /TAXON_ID=36767 /ORGANISM="Euplotes focardii, Strain TN1" /LENGTH=242 /DNA_ID=CAMNT_0053112419 /DNA_START=38 /DNA_END=766 /DNA_ORIENTATION=+
MACTGCWRIILMFVNVLTAILGMALLGVGIWALHKEESGIIFSTWAVNLNIALGSLMLFVSCLGFGGAVTAERKIVLGRTNCTLIFYFVFVLVLAIIQAVAVVYLAIVSGVISDARAVDYIPGEGSRSVRELERHIVEQLRREPKHWIDIQDHFDCCGYASITDDLATGPLCGTNPTPEPCRATLLNAAYKQSRNLTWIGAVVLLLEIVCLVGTCCLTCCASVSAAKRAGYNEMGGGLDMAA